MQTQSYQGDARAGLNHPKYWSDPERVEDLKQRLDAESGIRWDDFVDIVVIPRLKIGEPIIIVDGKGYYQDEEGRRGNFSREIIIHANGRIESKYHEIN